jgi:hypothetical protein
MAMFLRVILSSIQKSSPLTATQIHSGEQASAFLLFIGSVIPIGAVVGVFILSSHTGNYRAGIRY